jgi:hypothetical protein
MKKTSIALALCALIAASACKNEQKTATSNEPAQTSAVASNQELTPEQLGELGAQIRKNPDNAKQLLSARGLDEEKFEQAVRKVSEDPAAARRYSESYKKAGA